MRNWKRDGVIASIGTTFAIVTGYTLWPYNLLPDESPSTGSFTPRHASPVHSSHGIGAANAPSLAITNTHDTTIVPSAQLAPSISNLNHDQPSHKDKLARFFYARFMSAHSTADKMDNLRWALQQYGKDPLSENFEHASKGLGIDKYTLIKITRATAHEFFRDPTGQKAASVYDQIYRWNDMHYAFPYAGIDDDGNYSESLATAYTGYTFNIIDTRREQLIGPVLQEIVPYVETQLERILGANTIDGNTPKEIEDRVKAGTQNLSEDALAQLEIKISILAYASGIGHNTTLTSLGIKPHILENLDILYKSVRAIISNRYDEIIAQTDQQSNHGATPQPQHP